MAFALDASAFLHPRPTGVEKYVRRVVGELAAPELLGNRPVELWSSRPLPSSFVFPDVWKETVLPLPLLKKGWTHLRASTELVRRGRDQVYWVPGHEIPVVTGRARALTTLHDVVFRTVPEAYPPHLRLRQEWAVRHAVKKAEHIFVVSETTKQDLLTYYRADESRMTITPLAADPVIPLSADEQAREIAALGLTGVPYVLVVCRAEKKKGVDILLEAFAEAQAGNPELTLVWAGPKMQEAERACAKYEGESWWPRVRFLGYVTDNARAALYAQARAFFFPTRGEGVGLPVLEGLQAGLPVYCSDLPILREFGGAVPTYIPVGNAAAWSAAFASALREQNTPEEQAARIAQAGKFTWQKTAQLTANVLRSYV